MTVLARDAANREAVATIRRDIDLDGLAVQAEDRQHVGAGDQPGQGLGVAGEAPRQHDDPVVILAQAELTLGADHAGREVPIGLARGDRERALGSRQHATGQNHRDQVADLEVVGPADDPLGLARAIGLADVDRAPVDGLAILLRLGLAGEHPADDDRALHLAGIQALLLQADLDQSSSDLDAGGFRWDSDIFAQPVDGDTHQISIPNCASKRTSPSIMSRMSETPERNISARSMPIPKANPE